ncbi:MAG: HAMP domain-containing sensor histidine kinase [Pseudomonadota bacterium]
MTSLRKRAIAGAIFWACAVTVAGTYLLGSYLESQTVARFDDLVKARHTRAVVALANSEGDEALLGAQLADPVYQQPFSGEYWQIEPIGSSEILVSRSLTDFLLQDTNPSSPNLQLKTIRGPSSQTLRTTNQVVTLDDQSQWIVRVAVSTIGLARDREDVRSRLYIAFTLTGAFAALGAFALVLVTLRPIEKLRHDVADRWNSEGLLPADTYPIEVKPLVDDINELMTRNRDIVNRSRRQAADLAHALKTPAAILRNELEQMHQSGVAAGGSLDALNRLDAQLQRSLARMRATQSASSDNRSVDLTKTLDRMTRAFTALARNADRTLSAKVQSGLMLKVDRNDLDEICGNLLDNAIKWSTSAITLTAVRETSSIRIAIEDDGPGVPEDQRERVLDGGFRLDQSKPGTGLGLSIANDLVAAYGGTLQVTESERLGGALIEVRFPV